MGAESTEKGSRLRKYNERIFAVFGSLGAILFMSLLTMLAYSEVIKPLLRSSYDPVTTMISDEETQEALDKGLRLQTASYEMARRIFEDLPYYVIPVGQRTLKNPGTIAEMSGNLLSFGSYDSHYYYRQDTNNLIIWNRESGATEIVLLERRSLGSWEAYIENGVPYLLVLSEKIDTTFGVEKEQPNIIWASDVVLWIYALETGARTKIELPGKSGLELQTLDDSQLAFVLMGNYEEGSGFFDGEREPMSLYRLDAAAGVLIPAVPEAIRTRVQNILDGRSQEAE